MNSTHHSFLSVNTKHNNRNIQHVHHKHITQQQPLINAFDISAAADVNQFKT